MKIVFSSNISWSIYNFRKGLLKELKIDGNEVYTVAREDGFSKRLESLGFMHTNICINNNSKNPFKDLYLIYQYYKIYKKIAPDIICHNAIKPNIYGTIAASMLKVPVVNNISGLGTLFIKKSVTTKIAKLLYRISQRKASKVFFQNNDDFQLFLQNKLIRKEQCLLIPGSGVDTNLFVRDKEANKNNLNFTFLFIGRLLYDKGIMEYIEAAKIIKRKFSNIEFNVLGPFYDSNETAINNLVIEEWVKNGYINYLGETEFVKEEMDKANCVVLPSYREGLSKVLTEASSMSLPIITTNVSGCKDVVVDGVNGFLCKVRDSIDLAIQMEKMINLPEKAQISMGENGRKKAIEVFDEQIVIKHYKNAISSILEK
jgi:glycosyltransferase involved in cell wall biosynthesis